MAERTAKAPTIATPDDPLHPAELAALDRCETIIRRGLKTFIAVGEALLEIRDSRLYRATHPTFEDYLADRWQVSKAYGNRLIQAYEVARVLAPIGAVPATESQARELVPLLHEPEKLRGLWAGITERLRRPTAAAIREAREETTTPPPAEVAPARRLAAQLARVRRRPPLEIAASMGPDDAAALLGELAEVRAWCDRVTEALGARP